MASCWTMLVHVSLPSKLGTLMRRGATRSTEMAGDEALIDISGTNGLGADRRAKARIRYQGPGSWSFLIYFLSDLTLNVKFSLSKFHKRGAVTQRDPTTICRKAAGHITFRNATIRRKTRSSRWQAHPQNSPLRRRRCLRARSRFHTHSKTGGAPNSPQSYRHSFLVLRPSITSTMTILSLWIPLDW